ncbi:hypothetical protein [Bradyrhizobium valentinum]|uniref:Uncharacterized protein n=1 Tax=Bradyrhizobium valentinum TaxID=1518501 RepID=A0A0R3LXH0_9BRAD|nr:hypothetical protein [Bradyrhizobium valentinum]KRR12395.1 hypothetical protein CP49_08170 [Bradyrhizobium valentinum]
MTQVRKQSVHLTARSSVELEAGVMMSPGRYVGQSKQLGVATLNGVSWTQPEYTIEFSGQQLAAMGAKNMSNVISIEYDVTKFVRLGQITLS